MDSSKEITVAIWVLIKKIEEKGLNVTLFKVCRQFYLLYPQIGSTVSNQFVTEPGGPLNGSNRFVERLAKCKRHKVLMITSAPKDVEFTEGFSDAIARKEK